MKAGQCGAAIPGCRRLQPAFGTRARIGTPAEAGGRQDCPPHNSRIWRQVALRMKAPGPRAYFFALAACSALVLLAPIRAGDLPGYDDALYSFMAKDMLQGGHWMRFWAETHPPLFPLMQAGLFRLFGFSDMLAKLPAALAGLGWCCWSTAWRGASTGEWHGVLAMLAMAGSAYFVKYSSHAMTDVPFTFFFLCAICAWVLAETNPRWYLAAGIFTGLAQTTRDMMGLGLLVIFAAHALITRRAKVGQGGFACPLGIGSRIHQLHLALCGGGIPAGLPAASLLVRVPCTPRSRRSRLPSHLAFFDRAVFLSGAGPTLAALHRRLRVCLGL